MCDKLRLANVFKEIGTLFSNFIIAKKAGKVESTPPPPPLEILID